MQIGIKHIAVSIPTPIKTKTKNKRKDAIILILLLTKPYAFNILLLVFSQKPSEKKL